MAIAPFTNIHFEDEILTSIRSAKSEVATILRSIRDGTSVISYDGQIVTALPSDFLRLLTEWNSRSNVDHAIRNVIVSSLFSTEEKCSGAALIQAGLWCSDTNMSFEYARERCNYADMKKCLDYMGGSGMARMTAEAAIGVGAIGHVVEYIETDGPITVVKAHVGKIIEGEIEALFGDRVGRNFDLKNCAIVAVDGSVESVSSLHFAFESSAVRPIVILAQNFLPDVTNTMAETWLRGRGQFLPFKVSAWGVKNFLDLEQLGISCVSFERGDTFTALKIESVKGIDVTIQPTTCMLGADGQIDVSKISISVSRSLGGLTGLAKDRVKMLVGLARLSARNGVIRWENLQNLSSAFLELYSKELALPSPALVAGSRSTISLRKVLQDLGCVILISQGEKS